MTLEHRLRTAAASLTKRGFPMFASWIAEAMKELRDAADSHFRMCDTIQIHHEHFDKLYVRACHELEHPGDTPTEFVKFVRDLTNPEPDQR